MELRDMEVKPVNVGDVFADGHDKLWSCIMAGESSFVLQATNGNTKTIPAVTAEFAAFKGAFKFMWNENTPGIVQTSKGKPHG